MIVGLSTCRASSQREMTGAGWRLSPERGGPMRTVLTRLATTSVGSACTRSMRVISIALCITAVFSVWLAVRLRMTYLPAQADDVVRHDRGVDQTVATVQGAPVDLNELE